MIFIGGNTPCPGSEVGKNKNLCRWRVRTTGDPPPLSAESKISQHHVRANDGYQKGMRGVIVKRSGVYSITGRYERGLLPPDRLETRFYF